MNEIGRTMRGVLYEMGIIKEINKIQDIVDVPVSEDWYNKIGDWRGLYGGYLPAVHDTTRTTIGGGTSHSRIMSLGMPKIMSNEMASLIFNEKSEITVSTITSEETETEEDEFNEYLQEIFRKNRFLKNFREHLERMFALGGMVIKPFYDTKSERIVLTYYSADNFIPLAWDNRQITSGIFLSYRREGKYKYTHMEIHRWDGVDKYTIEHKLFKSDTTAIEKIGKPVPITELYDDLLEFTEINNIYQPLFVYMKPANANNFDFDVPLGISLYANVQDTLKLLDMAFDSYHREFKLGKRRILVPTSAIRSVIDPDTGESSRYFDADDEAYEAFNLGMDEGKIVDNTVPLRIDEHVNAIESLLNTLSMQCGFSGGTFTFNDSSVKTATEIISENSKTYKSKISHESVVEEGIEQLIACIVTLTELYVEDFNAPEDYEVAIAFNDVIAEDKGTEIERTISLVTSKLESRVSALMTIHGLTKEDAQEKLREIMEEDREITMSAVDAYGLVDPNTPAADPEDPAAPPENEPPTPPTAE